MGSLGGGHPPSGFALRQPIGVLDCRGAGRVILDEIQHVPELVEYLLG